MKIYKNNELKEVIEGIKANQLDKLYQRFLYISARELSKIEVYTENNSAPLNDELLKRFETMARVTRDISSELRGYEKERTQLDDNQLLQIMVGALKAKPHLLESLGGLLSNEQPRESKKEGGDTGV